MEHRSSANAHNHECTTCKREIRIKWNFGNNSLLLMSSDLCHKKMVLKSMNIPLKIVDGNLYENCYYFTLKWFLLDSFLIEKMIGMWICRYIILWRICHFLHNHHQCVRFDYVLSDYVSLHGEFLRIKN